jgi:uncharacterized UBP type Zn finger protein
MVKGEIISDYNCEPCQKKVDITKKTVFKRLPNTLIVRLNRIRYDYDTLRNVKENDRLEFGTSLNMRPYMLDEVVRKDKALIRQKREEKVEASPVPEMQEEGKGEGQEGMIDTC